MLLRMSGRRADPGGTGADPAAILSARKAIAGIHLDQRLVDYIVDLVRATREPAAVGSPAWRR